MKKLITLIFLFFVLAKTSSSAQTTNYKVYSVFVVNIAKFSSWPTSDTKDFKITVLGKSKVYDELNKAMANKDINGKKIIVAQVDNIQEVGDTQILYVSDGESSKINELSKSLAGKPVMIIAEREGLYRRGANFSFVILENNILRFDINKKESENWPIKISKNLISLANETI